METGREKPVSSEADDADRFAAALDGGGEPGHGDPDLARESALARRLGALSASLDPDPEDRERARRRLLAALASDDDPVSGGPARAS